MLATIWQRVQEDPVHVLVLCGSAVGSVLLFALVFRLLMTDIHPTSREEDGVAHLQ
jgi:hypothetical protein